ncbi:MAG: class I SAM-dependent methyltransferase [Actinobacteria bacterium]|nr:class I SAM-dependent methyltransferase [Actinomycetota bacterium]MBA3566259.1 class I SAM-dependent methyltransferase [Actinomycetota bacterium]MDQ3086285.1 site-specific DNA-methyltransferase [Actinomycetota bacterium]MDQ3425373.1 site-specific DNA-methyltransferase [Actinomycetota bacterium]
MAGVSQDALYAEIDLELSWSEHELPQVERTKHVHKLHPYLGKFIPQLVEVFLERYFAPGACVYDPFVGSGTTLVEANTFGADSVGCDISAFNCLLSRVKVTQYSLGAVELSLRSTLEEARQAGPAPTRDASKWLRRWYSDRSLGELLRYREVAFDRLEDPSLDVAKVILSRAARSARLTTHYDLDFPRRPVRQPYFCHKHKRTCTPVDESAKFLARYTADTVRRIREFSNVRTSSLVEVIHADSQRLDLPIQPHGVITSPPYPGLIDYHEQHRYAYELLGLDDRSDIELGRARRGTSRPALREYVDGMVAVFANASRQLSPGAPVVIVVNDSRGLFPDVLEKAGLRLDQSLTRHVNRRTGRRAGQFFESVLVCNVIGRY